MLTCTKRSLYVFVLIVTLSLVGAGAVDRSRASESLQLFDDVRAMTWRLLHPKP